MEFVPPLWLKVPDPRFPTISVMAVSDPVPLREYVPAPLMFVPRLRALLAPVMTLVPPV